MGLTAFDIVVFLLVGGAAVLGWMRGFVTEVLSVIALFLVVFALKLFHTPLAHVLMGRIGTASGSRSLPAAATMALMSHLPATLCEPGTTHRPLAGVQP